MGYKATTSMGNSPVISIDVHEDAVIRDGTKITVSFALVLKALTGSSWWGYGVNVSWGWSDTAGKWVQGADVQCKSNSETQWAEKWYWNSFTVDTGNYDAGTLRAGFCVYPNSGAWGNGVEVTFSYGSGYVAPSRGSVSVTVPAPKVDAWFETTRIDWSAFGLGTKGISRYDIYTQESDTWNGNYQGSTRIGSVTSSVNRGSYTWNGLTRHPMYYIKNVANGKCLDVNDCLFQDAQSVNAYKYNGSPAQRWSLESVPGETNTYYFHANDSTAHVLTVPNSEAYNGRTIGIYQRSGAANQRFVLVATGLSDKSYYIVPFFNQNYCLGQVLKTGSVVVYDRKQYTDQRWVLVDASDAWRGKWFRFNVVGVGTDGVLTDQNTYVGSYRKNIRPTAPSDPSASPGTVNTGNAVTLSWTDSKDYDFRTTKKEAISTAVTEAGSNLHGEIKSLRNSLEEYVAKNTADNELMKQSLLAIARDRISKAHSQCMRDGYISKYLLLALEELYTTYTKLGGNSFVSREMQDLRQLPLMSTDKLQQLSERR